MSDSLTEIQREHLAVGFAKIGPMRAAGTSVIRLYAHEADALYREFCRLANYATLLGDPSPAEMAGIYTTEEIEQMRLAEATGQRSQ